MGSLTYCSICFYFLIIGLFAGIFSGILPSFKSYYGITTEELSAVLLCMVLAAMISMFCATTLCDKFGSAIVCDSESIVMCLVFPLMMVMPNVYQATALAMIYGFCAGGEEIAVSAQAVVYEQALGKSAMGTFHAFYAMGAVSGSMLVGVLTMEEDPPFTICASGAATMFVGCLYFRRGLIPQHLESHYANVGDLLEQEMCSPAHQAVPTHDEDLDEDELDQHGLGHLQNTFLIRSDGSTDAEDQDIIYSVHPNANFTPCSDLDAQSTNSSKAVAPPAERTWNSFTKLVLLTAVSTISWANEGSVGDWSALFNRDVIGVSEAKAASSFAVFQLALLCGRLALDYVIDKYITRRNMIILSGLVGSMGLFVVVAASYIANRDYAFAVTTLGFAIAGVGVSPLWSLCISAAGHVDGYDATYALSVINGVGYVGLLITPPLLGFVAAMTGSLRWSFLLDGLVTLLVAPIGAFM